jgi:hypothetical protein
MGSVIEGRTRASGTATGAPLFADILCSRFADDRRVTE